MAYPQADAATLEAIGINTFMDAMPGPAIAIWLHVIRGQPKTLQEAVAYAMEVDAVLESATPRLLIEKPMSIRWMGKFPRMTTWPI